MNHGKMKTMDGNTAAAYVSYAFTDVAAIYPITPSSTMAESVDEWSAYGQKNLFGQEVRVVEMQSEGGASGALHGSLAAGALTTTYTASQGLLLMIPNMYKIAGELLPGVFHVSARALAGHALSIFGDHSDVMAVRQTGFAMLASCSVQEIMDLAGVAHLAAIRGRVPFLHFFDGFRTSSEVQKIETIDYADFDKLLDKEALQKFRDNALNPEHPVIRGTNQNPDIFFQAKEAANKFYEAIPAIVADYMEKISEITGRPYKLFDYYGHPDAENVIVAMGSVCETAEETIDYLMKQGKKVGLIKVRLYRPFAPEYLKAVMPKSVKRLAVLDRTKEPGALGDPLYMDLKTMYYTEEKAPEIYGGRYGLGSKDTTPAQIIAVYNNLEQAEPKNQFTIGIIDDVTNTSLPFGEPVFTGSPDTIRCKFWGLGSDGTVGANKSAIKIIGDDTPLYAQGYFEYDSKKSGGLTISHLRFGKDKIRSAYYVNQSDFVACHNHAYVEQYDLLKGLKDGGIFVLNCFWTEAELDAALPASMKKYLAQHNINFYIIDATGIAEEIGLGNRINMVMQAAFFSLSKVIPLEEAIKHLKDAVQHSYGKKGGKIVKMNNDAIDRGCSDYVKVTIPAAWADAVEENHAHHDVPDFIKDIMIPMEKHEGDSLPVSAFAGREDGTFPLGVSQYEKRGIAVNVPVWKSEHCIQCNQCALVCPHATIRPFLLNEDEKSKAPTGFETKKAIGKGLEGYEYRMQISPLDCLGCGNCADICPAKEKALDMKHLETQMEQVENWEYAVTLPIRDKLMTKETVKGSQFAKPYLEFSGACAGCGETPYAKLLTQLFGDRMMIANATGCSSIWGAPAPCIPYCTDEKGRGPSWANSLFEDNAEYGLGMALGVKQMREKIKDTMIELLNEDLPAELSDAFKNWIDKFDDGDAAYSVSDLVLAEIAKAGSLGADKDSKIKDIIDRKDFLVKKSVWSFGGDGWAYDIGYGGLDHVLASGEDINVLVFDTEVYSNTGGQSSKATPAAAIAKFAASGKTSKKKDLGMMAISYGNVYVAQVGMGADKNQLMKAIIEAERHKGPSIIIAYAPCINHGIKKGMGKTQENTKDAVEAGYWHLYRYNPEIKEQGGNPFLLDSKDPTGDYREFLMGQVRYASLKGEFPDHAEALFEKVERDSADRLASYKRLAAKECK
ncbi:MAG: pyruvate:ferredoxin (flavodoxin) oxidoreductase [Eubacteriales bacterium]|nr:pyruvate:ferredoxin (flavodoxin) oxidoreductase [Eubacteriales bacterium]MDD3349582.1 pyruvate:ferredoxin (flavodoxin) oxidoreductase [Eubacteriales bacterium]